MKLIQTETAAPAIGPYSQGVEANGFIFFSGQIAINTEGQFLDEDIKTQANQVFKNILALLTAEGCTKESVVKCTVFLHDIEKDFVTVNEIYAEFFNGHKPARSSVQVAKLPLNAKVEIEVIAVK